MNTLAGEWSAHLDTPGVVLYKPASRADGCAVGRVSGKASGPWFPGLADA
jgi:hypothetical protein